MSTTIGHIIDRIYRDYLTPPGEQPPRFEVGSGGITDSATSLPVDVTMLSPEEQDGIGPGTLIEIGTEVLLVDDDPTGGPPIDTVPVRRGMFNTTADAHSAADLAYIAGEDYILRVRVLDAVADAVDALFPDLYKIAVEETWAENGPIEMPAECREIIDVRTLYGSRWVRHGWWEELDYFPDSSTGVAFQINQVGAGAQLRVWYKKQATRPTAETDELEDLDIDVSWEKLLVATAVAELMANEDIDEKTRNFITESLEAEGFSIGQGADLRDSFLRYAEFLKRPLTRALAVRRRDRVVINKGY